METFKTSTVIAPVLEYLRMQGYKITKGWPAQPGAGLADRFLIAVPHCGREVNWFVLLNEKDWAMPPDFSFGDKVDIFVTADKLKSLKEWNIKHTNSLHKILSELKLHYNEYQRRKIHDHCTNERVKFEVDTLNSVQGVEFFYDFDDYGRNDVTCFIPLKDVNLMGLFPSELPSPKLKNITDTEKKVGIFLKFFASEKTPKPDIQLHLAPVWQDVLAGFPKPPAWTSEMCCLDYIPLFKSAIDEYIKNFQSRRVIFEELAKVFGTPLEYDVVEYKKIHFAVDINQLLVLMTIGIPATFPMEPPGVTLGSLSVSSKSSSIPKQIIRTITKYPYSPRWTMDEIAKRLRAAAMEALPAFKKAVEDESK